MDYDRGCAGARRHHLRWLGTPARRYVGGRAASIASRRRRQVRVGGKLLDRPRSETTASPADEERIRIDDTPTLVSYGRR